MEHPQMPDERRKQQLAQRRTTLLASLGRADQFLQRYQEERDGFEVAIRLENLEEIWRELCEIQLEIEDGETSNEGMMLNLSYRSSFETQYFKIKAGMRSKLALQISQSGNLPTNPPPPINTLRGLKLPTISLPDFSGDYMDWLAFHDTFLALIHSNPDLPEIQKFHYLRAAVKGEASQVIESIGICSANYTLAWQALVNRYANEYLLKKRHLQAIVDIPSMKRETAASLHALVDEFERHVKTLKQLKEPTDSWSTMLEHLVCIRLHEETLKAWEDHASTIKEPSYANLVEFLQRRMRVLESISVNIQQSGSSHSYPLDAFDSRISTHVSTSVAMEGASVMCPVCDQPHPLLKCYKFSSFSLQDRLNLVNTRRLCSNCLRDNHFMRRCPSKFNCRTCQKRHHTMLHPGFMDNGIHGNTSTGTSQGSNQAATQVNLTTAGEENNQSIPTTIASVNSCDTGSSLPLSGVEKNVFMLTAIVIVVDKFGNHHLAQALLDSASQPNLMTERMAQLLGLQRVRSNVIINGVGGLPQRARESVFVQVQSRKTNFSLDMNCLILKKITSALPFQDVSITDWKLPTDVFLADPSFNKQGDIDMIIGNEHFFSCFVNACRLRISESLPLLVDSVFGWLVSGAANVDTQPSAVGVLATSLHPLEESIERFWKIEDLSKQPNYSLDEAQCEQLYSATTTRDTSGRYVVRLPRRSNFDELLGDSKSVALRRFHLLERKLNRDICLKNEYQKFIAEYLALGHMRLANTTIAEQCCYLPHHAVIKEASTTTKVRVVFDGSAKTTTGKSLNDALLVGPVVQDELLAIVLRFRTYPVAIVADIEKMYRQVLIHPGDTPLQKILWRFRETDPVQEYELSTVTYGLGPSSFLATRTLKQLAYDEGTKYPNGGPALLKGFYVDDFIGGAESTEEAIQLRKELTELLASGGFKLRKWTSSDRKVLEGLPLDQIGTQSCLKFDVEETVKTLGIIWDPGNDLLRFNNDTRPREGSPTKRSILSDISQLFDPLGLISPIIIRGKMLMQQLWLLSCGWDEEVPDSLATKWLKYTNQLSKIGDFHINRYVLQPHCTVQLHTFADASESAYGACTYARSIDSSGNIRVELLASKSRVAPLKRLTLPRLELCAADLAAKLHTQIVEALQIKVSASYFWSDSKVALQWIKAPPNTWQTFVANRVAQIQAATQGTHWNHVAGIQNPADMISRGMDVNEFLECTTWKHGPTWLALLEYQWPIYTVPEYPQDGEERRRIIVACTNMNSDTNPIFSKFSSFTRLVHVTAYCMRFFHNVRHKIRRQSIPTTSSKTLSAEEINRAKDTLVRLAQEDEFKEELHDLRQQKGVSKRSPIHTLAPFLDPEGLLRVGGRLRLSDQPYNKKHPSLIPSFHPLARMLAKHFHLTLIHGGGRLTLAAMREQYWPVHGRRLVRSVIRHCYRCTRVDPVPLTQQTGQLPATRITPSRPFNSTGIDYAGPLYLKPVHKRAAATKVYVCLFVCFCTKAVHIELVGDLSTQAFLSALKRFVSRRGRPAHIYSDNGKNFEGAKNTLEEIQRFLTDEDVYSWSGDEGITWHLNPPKAPHFGGLWEAAVKVAKKQLYRQLGSSRLSFEDLSTVLTQIEGSMNSRPLVPLTEDPSDLACLTPAHFLVGSTLHAVPELDIRNLPISRLDHYQKLQRIHQQFWQHWQAEYLQELQKDNCFSSPNHEIQPGRLVVVMDEQLVPIKWPLARIIAVHPGLDKLIRVVDLRTARGIIRRPITKICLLPMESVEQSSNAEKNEQSDVINAPTGSQMTATVAALSGADLHT
ncbi:uncharacterized protein LOC131683878 [Topomyia yanbarensis]|uniref:uncharacterized protein LOC131683878 n=1 Tax=Topomyia yanbarensis TaxID=2498891 RepID=UPI00273B6792|nr:uncharacterized protein LOC131683878 [Topomyia yanbarensis]